MQLTETQCGYIHAMEADSKPTRHVLQIVAHATENKNVVTACCQSELLRQLLPHLAEQLELCQKSLTAYLETKVCFLQLCLCARL